ncbi:MULTISPECIES: hypothetical protein [Pelosinus]|jgi:hypothetical protein|uniref:Uncharacterized protein n=1 Tax=Pelosinus fermentans B4 TaxID=1149862 RepID=I9LJV9_9FIRM|nr:MULTISPECIES: hypothetical protein [Pelosinus]EIW20711.1 hypothetical protein FB4_1923 [Pelosinus fermentans B4]EIW25444.1 hypothetical protein FA11_2603 [Pelosinus fermentans A11]OAM93704.1 hypothetical protein FR7_01721 [Pelosinus fermentans DSM 17108]SDQ87173.1 hypothetical protein SAMN04515679_1807 [Pelosinus fermentans]
MKLTELFPDMPKVILNGKEYEVIFNTRSMRQLEFDYPDKIQDGKEITSPELILNALNSAFGMMKTTDLINLLHAGLIHTNQFNKETLVDAMQPCFFPVYMDHIILAYQLSKSTPEQLEKMEVMSAVNGSKKKMDQEEIMPPNMPTIE